MPSPQDLGLAHDARVRVEQRHEQLAAGAHRTDDDETNVGSEDRRYRGDWRHHDELRALPQGQLDGQTVAVTRRSPHCEPPLAEVRGDLPMNGGIPRAASQTTAPRAVDPSTAH